ncbi:putative RiPP precursor [Mesorhizobium sp. B3-1-6]|nr:putative RiPP precursor [Mesorhizobium sp. B3-1-6]TPI57703.1 putative RiPP precursor [Mesorhizobium sp. B3-1-7]
MGEFSAKKTYEKPVLVRKGKLSVIVAGPSVPPPEPA